MISSIIICLGSFAILGWWLRFFKVSLGLPIAYLFALLFIHVPGAFAHLTGGDNLDETKATEIGIRYTALGVMAFVIGVIGYGLISGNRYHGNPSGRASRSNMRFNIFCVLGGWMLIYVVREFVDIPTINAIVDKGSAIWIFGTLLGLGDALRRKKYLQSVMWIGIMMTFPMITLLRAGFLSFGSTPVFIILSALVISTRSRWRVGIAIPVATLGFVVIFLAYFQHRSDFRQMLGENRGFHERVAKTMEMASDVEMFDPENILHLHAFDERLNQNRFVGLAAQNIKAGEVELLYGRSIWEGTISLIPRIVWPSKPVYGGSPGVIMEMTDIVVNERTSYGVGNVMEFYINFGISSLIIGFVILGGLFGWLDRNAAAKTRNGEWMQSVLYFLPAVGMIQPGGSVVEVVGGAVIAFVSAWFWILIWHSFEKLTSDGGSLSGRRRMRRKQLGRSPDQ